MLRDLLIENAKIDKKLSDGTQFNIEEETDAVRWIEAILQLFSKGMLEIKANTSNGTLDFRPTPLGVKTGKNLRTSL
jgi:hypothetical protein